MPGMATQELARQTTHLRDREKLVCTLLADVKEIRELSLAYSLLYDERQLCEEAEVEAVF